VGFLGQAQCSCFRPQHAVSRRFVTWQQQPLGRRMAMQKVQDGTAVPQVLAVGQHEHRHLSQWPEFEHDIEIGEGGKHPSFEHDAVVM
jgi:hypothetical protein